MTKDEYTTQLDTSLMLLLQGEITSDQVEQLQARIQSDPATLKYCTNILAVSAGLEAPCQETDEQAVERLQAILRADCQRPKKTTRIKPIFWKTAGSMAAAVLVGLGLFWMMQSTRHQGLAQVVNSLAANWETPLQGRRLDEGVRYLKEGMVELKMASGAKVILQGPCRFSVDSGKQLGLTQGTLSIDVPRQARGFVVQVPGATITDYGTRFGVIVEAGGAVEAHVFQGRVEVQTRVAKQVLQQGIAAMVSPVGTISRQPARSDRFIQSMPAQQSMAVPGKRLDLADVVGGGNGYGSGVPGQGINLLTSETTRSMAAQPVVTEGPSYVMLFDSPYLDGVFVPNGPATVVSSADHHFLDCPVTNGATFTAVLGGAVGVARLDGQVVGNARQPALALFPNAGVTFNLMRIRENNMGVQLTGFSALAGMSEGVTQPRGSSVEFWVLVDGQQRYKGQVGSDSFEVLAIDIPLNPQDQFLTLMTTATGGTEHCEAYFARPMLQWTAP